MISLKLINESKKCLDEQENENFESIWKPKTVMWGPKFGFYSRKN